MRRAVLLPLLVLPLVACSSGSSGSSSSASPSLQQQRSAYLSKTEAVCKDANDRAAKLSQPTDVAGVPAFADAALDIARSTVQGVEAVPPPAADKAELESKVLQPLQKDLGTATDYAGQFKAAAAAGDNAALLRLLQDRPKTTADVAFMKAYGFSECVKAAQLAGG